ncbi:MAG: extracellular solute-binding protein [Eubacteriales bacterium]|nr:extracellular solute-binding protein [Eubacteriales bacterium]
MKKRLMATLLTGAIVAASLPAALPVYAADTELRMVNGKIEIDAQLKAYAEAYEEETGVKVTIESLGGGVDINGQLKNYYAAGNMPDIFCFAQDSYQSFKDWLEPLDGEAWIDDTDYEFVGEDGKVYGFPFAVEGIGMVYNKDILDKAGIDPATLTTIDAYKAAFETIDGMKDELGIQAVCSVAAESGQMYWSTGNHMMATYYAQGVERGDTTLVDKANAGEIDTERMGQFADWVGLLFQYADPNVLVSGTYDDQLALWAQGKAAFITQGNWIDPSLPTYDVSFDCGLAPCAFSTEETDGILVDAPSFWGIYKDSENVDAAKAFFQAISSTEAGQKCLVEECGTVSPFKSCELVPSTPLAASMIPYIQDGKTYAWDWLWQKEGVAQNATGLVFEAYAKGDLDRDGFVDMMASTIADYMAAN